MSNKIIDKLINELVELQGEVAVENLIKNSIQSNNKEGVLTILANKGVHHVPSSIVRGELFVASEGSLDFSCKESVLNEYEKILRALAMKLKESAWKEIYLIPFGHSTLSMQIKLLVYRVTHIETQDVFYTKDGKYYDLCVDLRSIIVRASS